MRAWPGRRGRVGNAKEAGTAWAVRGQLYASWLAAREYTALTADKMLAELGALGRWMNQESVEPGNLDQAGIERYLAARRASGLRRVASLRAMQPLVWFLREAGVMAVADGRSELTPPEQLIADRDWLVGERALAEPTVIRYERLARRFMAGRVSDARRARRCRLDRRRCVGVRARPARLPAHRHRARRRAPAAAHLCQ